LSPFGARSASEDQDEGRCRSIRAGIKYNMETSTRHSRYTVSFIDRRRRTASRSSSDEPDSRPRHLAFVAEIFRVRKTGGIRKGVMKQLDDVVGGVMTSSRPTVSTKPSCVHHRQRPKTHTRRRQHFRGQGTIMEGACDDIRGPVISRPEGGENGLMSLDFFPTLTATPATPTSSKSCCQAAARRAPIHPMAIQRLVDRGHQPPRIFYF
jgi:hypothetical protein